MSTSKKNFAIANVEQSVADQSSTIAMQGQLRQAIFDAINEEDVTEIVKKQVEKAKAGDERSLQFIMKYVLGFGGQPVTLNQINVMDVETAARISRSSQ